MAAVSFPRFPSLRFSPSLRWKRWGLVCSLSTKTSGGKSGSAILWYKQDLRLDDHPGIAAAAETYSSVFPLYVFDRRILNRYSDEMLELVLAALTDLRQSLKEQGTNLLLRFGNSEDVIRELVQEVGADAVFAEEEVEYHLRKLNEEVKESLITAPFVEGKPIFEIWRLPFYYIKNLKALPECYDEFEKLKLIPTLPISPLKLPAAAAAPEIDLDWGTLPSFNDLQEFMLVKPCNQKESWSLIQELSAESILQAKLSQTSNDRGNRLVSKCIKKRRVWNSVFVTPKANIVGGGTSSVLNALAAYLRYLEGTVRDDWQELHERVRDAEVRDGASFISLFGPALYLGIISRRRVHYEAIKYEKEQNAGFVSPFGYSTATVSSAVDAVCSFEWYWMLALKSQIINEQKYSIRIWRWNGHLIQYTVAGNEGPAILLVHGFGAFFDHYRNNIDFLAEGNNRVWAITILGFGRSDKPNVVYTELLWAELLRDFIIQVVGEQVHLVGNSIGGYFVAILASLWPTLATSVILINSAGNIVPDYSYRWFPKERRTSGATGLGAHLLLIYLRWNLQNIVKSCYPTNAKRADDWLMAEMARASYDPGTLVVLESIFSFDLTVPLNYLLEEIRDKVLFVQGMKDPISDSKSKVAMIREHLAGVMIKELDAGHCPHDERPEEVNNIILKWVAAVESEQPVAKCLLA